LGGLKVGLTMSFVFEYKLFLVCIFALEYLGLTKLGIVVGVSEITKYHAIKGKIRNDKKKKKKKNVPYVPCCTLR
jgi:hypothetical protein